MAGSNPPVLPDGVAATVQNEPRTRDRRLSSSIIYDDNNFANGRQGKHSGEQQFVHPEFEQDMYFDIVEWVCSLIVDPLPSDGALCHTPGIEAMVSPQYNQQATLPDIEDFLASNTHPQAPSINNNGNSGDEELFTPPVNFRATTDGHDAFLGSTNNEETFTPNNEMENSRIQDPLISQGLSEGHDTFPRLEQIILVDEAGNPTTPVNSHAMVEMAMDGGPDQMENWGTQGQKHEGRGRRKNKKWDEREVNSLLEGVNEYGISRWSDIRARSFAESTRTAKDLKDKFKNLTKMANNQNRILRGARLPEDVFRRVLCLNKKYGKASS